MEGSTARIQFTSGSGQHHIVIGVADHRCSVVMHPEQVLQRVMQIPVPRKAAEVGVWYARSIRLFWPGSRVEAATSRLSVVLYGNYERGSTRTCRLRSIVTVSRDIFATRDREAAYISVTYTLRTHRIHARAAHLSGEFRTSRSLGRSGVLRCFGRAPDGGRRASVEMLVEYTATVSLQATVIR